MKNGFLCIFLLLSATSGFAQSNFITKWTFPSASNSIICNSQTSGTVNYTWSASPSGLSGSGSITTPSYIRTTITLGTSIPAGNVVTVSMEPQNLRRFAQYSAQGQRLTDVAQWGSVPWTSMDNAFNGCSNLATITASDAPDLSGVSSMVSMFQGCTAFTGFAGLSNWDVSNITNMQSMFQNASSFNQDISTWNTGNVTNMQSMFANAAAFNQPIGVWNVSSVGSMNNLFNGATAFNQNIGAWTLNGSVTMTNMLNNCGMDCGNFSKTLMGWSANPSTPTSKTLGATGRQYGPFSAYARTHLTTATGSGGKGWTISGDGIGSCDLVNNWLGVNSNVLDNANWSLGVPPLSNTVSIHIPATAIKPVINADLEVGNVTFENGAEITISASAELKIFGNISINGSAAIKGAGKAVLKGSAPNLISGQLTANTLQLDNSNGASLDAGAVLNINDALELKNGTFSTTSGTLTFKSPNEQTSAMLDNFSSGFSGTISGSIKAERGYANASNGNLYNQHYFGSPVNNVAVTQLAAAQGANNVFVTPTADCNETQLDNTSNYGNVFEYDESHVTYCNLEAWKVRSSGNMQNGSGYSVVKSGAGTLTLSGTPNLGDYSISNLNNSGWNITTKQGNHYEGGWHLLSNPYLASFDLDYSANSAFDNNVLVLHTHGPFAGTYQPLSMSGSGVIAPFQGFFARKSIIGGAPATFSFSNTNRSRTQTAFHKAGEHQMSLMVEGNGYADITYFNFNVQATNGFDAAFDGCKFSSFLNQPTIYSIIGGTWASVNTNSDVQSTPHIPVGFNAGSDGVFQITASGFDELVNTTVYLEDKKENVMHNLTQTPYYTFAAQKGDNNERFVLHFNQMISSIDNEAKTPIGVNLFPNPANEMVYIEVKEFKPKNQEIKVELVDMNGKTVLSTTINNGKGINISQIAPAVYQLKITTENGSFVKRLVKE